ncbi:MAG TPA: MYXO-CTERM sorting domain-containing protein [Polyangiaceae bacterium]|nr:MYXO-CTERM sorting domain-containing protein [Polyangiaceae bacterium]
MTIPLLARTRTGLAALAAGALVTLCPKASHAEQFTLFDVTFNFTWQDAINASPSKSHYYVKADKLNTQRPTNWIAPIDYRTGKVHIYLEVLEKPAGGQKQGWALCYVGGGSYGCPYTKYYTEKGVYESEVDMTSFYNNATIDWTRGITEVDLVYTINDSGQGHVHFFPELQDKTTPTKVRIAMVQVSKGATYDPTKLPSTGGGMGGAGGTGGTGGVAGSANGGAGGTAAGAGGANGAGGAAGLGGSAGGSETASGGVGGSAPVTPTGGTAPTGTAGGPGSAGTSSFEPSLPANDEAAGCSFHGGTGGMRVSWLGLAVFALVARIRRRGSVTPTS